MFVIDSLEYFQLFGHVPDRSRLTRLDGDLLHCHQFAGGVVDGRVNLPETPLANLRAEKYVDGIRMR